MIKLGSELVVYVDGSRIVGSSGGIMTVVEITERQTAEQYPQKLIDVHLESGVMYDTIRIKD